MKLFNKFYIIIVFFIKIVINYPLPTVIFHDFGGSCFDPYYSRLINYIKERNGPQEIKCLEATGAQNDYLGWSFFEISKKACKLLNNDINFHGKNITVLGFSSGAVIGRYIIQACNFGGTVKRFISVGGPLMGISDFPENFLISITSKLEKKYIYSYFIQLNFGPAQIYRDPKNIVEYSKYNLFLSDLNNEFFSGKVNNTYIERMKKLDIMVLIKFTNDTKIIPNESEHFGYKDSNDKVLKINETDIYLQDKIGLKYLLENDRIIFEEIEGDYLEYSFDDVERLILPHLK